MNEMTFLDWAYGVAMFLIGLLVAVTRRALEDQQTRHDELAKKVDARDEAITKSIADLRNSVSRDYVPRAEINDTFAEIKQILVRIDAKLDGKVDKR